MVDKKKKDKVDEGEDELEEIVLDDETVVLQEEKEDNLLIPRNDYLSSGVHIGTKLKTIHSEKWIYRTTSYGLYVIDLLATDERVRVAAKFLASFDPEKIMVCSVRRYGRAPVRAFCKVTGAKALADRFIPGTLTNPLIDQFKEADVLLMIDPHADKQALAEAQLARIPVVSFIDTDDYLYNIDLAIPSNNRGRKSLSKMLWLLARQIMRERGKIAKDEDIDITPEEFESKISRIPASTE
ncbi:MAG: 30S ribosomal protein S2 [Candidatus Lokiarchaeota archaeon]|nr:30S ribosomal protein S2 [Candidatus Harpocratesius repetitus]